MVHMSDSSLFHKGNFAVYMHDGSGVLLLFDELQIDMQSESLFREVIRVP